MALRFAFCFDRCTTMHSILLCVEMYSKLFFHRPLTASTIGRDVKGRKVSSTLKQISFRRDILFTEKAGCAFRKQKHRDPIHPTKSTIREVPIHDYSFVTYPTNGKQTKMYSFPIHLQVQCPTMALHVKSKESFPERPTPLSSSMQRRESEPPFLKLQNESYFNGGRNVFERSGQRIGLGKQTS